ncbi:unnamed protein product [Owenia fusiformis]|uniref:Uncharacterized protein n=1 Tax=Owenia fusiformis TaxID=6347 RepID=A0A8J1UPA3_OWEFU|nr:unnamed protein product [Owenia fusiformis]
MLEKNQAEQEQVGDGNRPENNSPDDPDSKKKKKLQDILARNTSPKSDRNDGKTNTSLPIPGQDISTQNKENPTDSWLCHDCKKTQRDLHGCSCCENWYCVKCQRILSVKEANFLKASKSEAVHWYCSSCYPKINRLIVNVNQSHDTCSSSTQNLDPIPLVDKVSKQLESHMKTMIQNTSEFLADHTRQMLQSSEDTSEKLLLNIDRKLDGLQKDLAEFAKTRNDNMQPRPINQSLNNQITSLVTNTDREKKVQCYNTQYKGSARS